MEVRVQAITADLFSVEIMVCTGCDPADLLIGSYISHNGKDLACEHHTHFVGKESFHRASVVIVVAVKPSLVSSSVDPFLFPEITCEPVGSALQIICQYGQRNGEVPAADLVPAASGVVCQQYIFGIRIFE